MAIGFSTCLLLVRGPNISFFTSMFVSFVKVPIPVLSSNL
jgi:hypothetical protein